MHINDKTIKEIVVVTEDGDFSDENTVGFEGYIVRMVSGKSLYVLIAAYQNCCEDWGYMTAEDDDLDYYVGAVITKVDVVMGSQGDTGFRTLDAIDYDSGGVSFLRIHTTKGTLVIAVYNAHNGYYGHDVKIIPVYGETRHSSL